MANQENIHDFVTASQEPQVGNEGDLICRQAMSVTLPANALDSEQLTDMAFAGFNVEGKPNADNPSNIDVTLQCTSIIGSMVNETPRPIRACVFQREGFAADRLPFCAVACRAQSASVVGGSEPSGTQSS